MGLEQIFGDMFNMAGQNQSNGANPNSNPNSGNSQAGVGINQPGTITTTQNGPGGRNNVHIIHTSFSIFFSKKFKGLPQQGGLGSLVNNIQRLLGNFGGAFSLGEYVFFCFLKKSDEPRPTSTQCIRDLVRTKITDENISQITIKDCTVCKEDYKIDDQLMELPCKHLFHEDCILPWLNEHNSCPTCRHALPVRGE